MARRTGFYCAQHGTADSPLTRLFVSRASTAVETYERKHSEACGPPQLTRATGAYCDGQCKDGRARCSEKTRATSGDTGIEAVRRDCAGMRCRLLKRTARNTLFEKMERNENLWQAVAKQ